MTDFQINEAVARKLGHKNICSNYVSGWHDCELAGKGAQHCGPPRYSTDIAAAWEVVEFTRSDYAFEIHSTPTNYIAHFSGPTWKQLITGEADTAPMAICLAFLKLAPAVSHAR